MRRLSWQVMLGLSLVLLSLILYGIHYAVFQDSHHIYIFMLGDIAFVPIEVLLVTLIIHQLLNEREKRIRLEKLNMVIGTFFSSVGTRLLTYLSDADPGLDKIREHLIVSNAWSDQEFADASRSLKNYEYKIDITGVNLEELRSFLKEKQELLVRILENPTLLEHEAFTELLRAVGKLGTVKPHPQGTAHAAARTGRDRLGDSLLLIRQAIQIGQRNTAGQHRALFTSVQAPPPGRRRSHGVSARRRGNLRANRVSAPPSARAAACPRMASLPEAISWAAANPR